jgi:virginiamycin B lyase
VSPIRKLAAAFAFLLTGCAAGAVALPPNGSSGAATSNAKHPDVISEFAIVTEPSANPVPYQIVRGSDGAMWFTEEGTGTIGRIDASGRIRRYPLLSKNAQPEGIASGDDGSLYIAENEGPNQYATHVARMTTSGNVVEWGDGDYMPMGAATGPSGEEWFTQGCGGLSLIETTDGPSHPLSLYYTPGTAGETPAIVRGPDGGMWFNEDGTASIGRITATTPLVIYQGYTFHERPSESAIARFPASLQKIAQSQRSSSRLSYPDVSNMAAVGPDGNIWWTGIESNVVWAMSVEGKVVHVYHVPTKDSAPWGIATGKDGALWFTEYAGNKIGRVTTGGAFSEYPIPTPNAKPQGLAFGPKGDLWFVESGSNRIGRIGP